MSFSPGPQPTARAVRFASDRSCAHADWVAEEPAEPHPAARTTSPSRSKTNTYVTDTEEFFKHVDVRMEYFGALPTSTTVEVRKLAHPDLVVKVEAFAVVD
jgi:hypothetical protein